MNRHFYHNNRRVNYGYIRKSPHYLQNNPNLENSPHQLAIQHYVPPTISYNFSLQPPSICNSAHNSNQLKVNNIDPPLINEKVNINDMVTSYELNNQFLNLIKTNDPPLIMGKVNKKDIIFVVDTGASTSIINKNFLPSDHIIYPLNNVTLTTANGSHLHVVGKTTLELSVSEIAAKSDILTQVAPDGWCGVSTLEAILNNRGIDINAYEIKKLLGIDLIIKRDFTTFPTSERENKFKTRSVKQDVAKISNNDSHTNTTQFSENVKSNISLSPTVTTSENELDWDINPALPIDQQNKLRGSCKVAPIELQLSSNKIINLPNFKLSRVERNEIEKQTEELLKAGIVEESSSPYSNPVFLVAKNQGQCSKSQEGSKEYRMVIDFRKLNEIIYRESFPLPIIQNLYDCLAGNQYFSSLDATSGFHQIELSENSKALTAYSTENYHVQFTRLPFGLSNAPQFYQAAMCKVMAGLNYRHNICYLDDCVAFGKSFESHLHSLELTFQRFLKYNLKLKPSKCRFGYQELKVLGNIIDTKGIRPTQQGIETIQKFPQPKTIKQLRSFLGLANYFRRYIPKFSNIAKPLTDLTRGKFNSKRSPIKWEDTHERAFLELKSKLTSQPVLAHYDENAETIIVTDGSKLGLGAILQQRNQNNEIHPVAFSSKKLTKAEGRYSAMDLECLAIFHALTVFRPYVHGKYFEIWTDHKNLTSFDYSIKYKEGIFNKAADCLSRIIDEPPKLSEFTELSKIGVHTILQQPNVNLVQPINIQLEQASDNYLQNIITAIKNPNENCQKRKPFKQPKPPKIGMYPLEKGEIMQEIYLDYIGPLSNLKSNKYILVATDRINLILRFGCMRTIRSDNGTHFTGKTVKQLLESLNVDQKFGIPYHPTSQGQVERQNQTLVDMISNYVKDNEKLWSDYLPYMVFAYNSSIHKVTGYSPFYLVHGFEPKSVFELALIPPEDQNILSEISKIKKIRKLVPELLKQASEQVKQKHPLSNTTQYNIGDKVLVKNETSNTKFRDRYNGPYEIIKAYPPFTYIVKMPKNNRLENLPVHIDQIKPFHSRSGE
ncbi:uncharacterized protein LOC126895280 [Daktulosphaira vitifoliae]|uniref:uncharacterized protein LOC126895280 n=1 Tax=Daktulosphaira vitifoliae TaxID=58002 RepID=UPI0021A98E80|nr:uncharacterized protein LOC126895280 [Daktulosphaira vitifoliae]